MNNILMLIRAGKVSLVKTKMTNFIALFISNSLSFVLLSHISLRSYYWVFF